MTENQKEMLISEYQELSSNVRTSKGFRLTILGFSITIIGFVFADFIDSGIYQKLIFEICFVFIIYALVKSMSSITRHLIIYCLRLKEIENEFKINGFWNKWELYLKNNQNDSNTRTIYQIVEILNIIILIFIITSNSIIYFNSIDDIEQIILIIATTLLTGACIYNFIEANSNLSPNNHWKKIKKNWEEISKKDLPQ